MVPRWDLDRAVTMPDVPEQRYRIECGRSIEGRAPCSVPSARGRRSPRPPDIAGICKTGAAQTGRRGLGYPAVPPHNPYWAGGGVTIPDPDGWRVVLMARRGITARTVDPGELPDLAGIGDAGMAVASGTIDAASTAPCLTV